MLGTLKIYSRLSFAFIFFIIFVMRVVCVSCHCLESERNHLLQLQASLKVVNDDLDEDYSHSEELVTWNTQGWDCCLWSGVGCSADGKVISLDLSNKGIMGRVNDSNSLFSLKYLKRLNLAFNYFHSTFSTKFDKLINLNYLNLSNSGFSGQIPIDILSLTNLQTLDISHISSSSINLENPKLDTVLRNLSNLQELLLDDVNILAKDDNWSGAISSFFPNLQVLSLSRCGLKGTIDLSLSKLRHLSKIQLAYNDLHGVFPKEIFHLQTLKAIDLSGNTKLQGSFPEISKNNSLEELVLLGTDFWGELPYTIIENLKSLSRLDISDCRFSGALPKSLSNLTKLTFIDLSDNMFLGLIPSFTLLSDLTYLDLSYNNFSGPLPDFNMKNLRNLRLSSNNLSGALPNSLPGFLRNQSNLKYLDLSQNQFSGEIPNWIWELTSKFSSLNLSHNFFEGIERPVLTVPSFYFLDLHSNRLRGELPFFPQNVEYLDYSMNNFSSSIPHLIPSSTLYFLSLSDNHLNGSIPESICNAFGIQVIDLSNNSLSGPVPQCISTLNESLVVLNLGMNHLNGTISDALLQPGCQLETLDVNENHFSGKVPESLLNCKGLQVLNLGNNQINDTFPCWLKRLSYLSVFVLNSNKFHGELRCPETNRSWPMLQIVDLSSNSFSGKLLAEWFLSWKGMMVSKEFNSISNTLYLGKYYQDAVTVNLKGNKVKLEKILTIFTSIDLSNNSFEGTIPQELGNLKALYYLNLSRNNFMGPIPPSLGNLKQLESLDLSRNKLSGSIPQQLADLTFLQVLNMSFNQLEGRIPSGGQFDNLCEDSFLGNKGLVGLQVKRKCKEIVASPATTLHDNNTRPKKSKLRWELIGAEVGFTVGLGIIIGSLIFWQRWRECYFDRVEQVLLKILCLQNQSKPNQLRRRGGN